VLRLGTWKLVTRGATTKKVISIARKEEGCPLQADLADVRQMVLSGKFDPKQCPGISYSKLHERSIDATSPVKRGKGCKCKHGVCGKACGCKRKE
jgi:hypothetical protein